MANELYRLANGPSGGFVITKYDTIGYEILSNYHMADAITCECPAGHRPTCRHRQMLPQMIDRIDTDWFYRFDDGVWAIFDEGKLRFEPKGNPMNQPFGYKTPATIPVADHPRPETPAEGEGPAPFQRRF